MLYDVGTANTGHFNICPMKTTDNQIATKMNEE